MLRYIDEQVRTGKWEISNLQVVQIIFVAYILLLSK